MLLREAGGWLEPQNFTGMQQQHAYGYHNIATSPTEPQDNRTSEPGGMEFPTADAEGTGRALAQVWTRLISMVQRYP